MVISKIPKEGECPKFKSTCKGLVYVLYIKQVDYQVVCDCDIKQAKLNGHEVKEVSLE